MIEYLIINFYRLDIPANQSLHNSDLVINGSRGELSSWQPLVKAQSSQPSIAPATLLRMKENKVSMEKCMSGTFEMNQTAPLRRFKHILPSAYLFR